MIKNNEILPFPKAWMESESIMLSEISQTEKDKYHMISLICGIYKNDIKELIYKTETHTGFENRLNSYQRGIGEIN